MHSQPREHRRDPFAGKLAHQVVFERQKEARRARISLPAGSAAKLVIDPPALVPLGSDDVQPADTGDLAPFGLHLGLVSLDGLFPHFLRDIEPRLVERPAVFVCQPLQVGPGHELGISSQNDVGASARHVRRDRHGPSPSGLGHDLRLALVVLGIQDLVRDAIALEHLGELFRFLDRRRSDQDRTPARICFLANKTRIGYLL